MAKHKLGENEQLQEIISEVKKFDKAEKENLYKMLIKNPLWMDKRRRCRTKANGVIYGECKQIRCELDSNLQIAFSRFIAKHQDILRYEIDNRRTPHLKRMSAINTQVEKSKWWEYVNKTINNTMLKDKVLTQPPFEYFLDYISAGRFAGVTRDLNEDEAREFFIGCCGVLDSFKKNFYKLQKNA